MTGHGNTAWGKAPTGERLARLSAKPTQLRVFITLASFNGTTGEAGERPIVEICRRAGYPHPRRGSTQHRVIRAIQGLEASGDIRVKRRAGQASIYYVNLPTYSRVSGSGSGAEPIPESREPVPIPEIAEHPPIPENPDPHVQEGTKRKKEEPPPCGCEPTGDGAVPCEIPEEVAAFLSQESGQRQAAFAKLLQDAVNDGHADALTDALEELAETLDSGNGPDSGSLAGYFKPILERHIDDGAVFTAWDVESDGETAAKKARAEEADRQAKKRAERDERLYASTREAKRKSYLPVLQDWAKANKWGDGQLEAFLAENPTWPDWCFGIRPGETIPPRLAHEATTWARQIAEVAT